MPALRSLAPSTGHASLPRAARRRGGGEPRGVGAGSTGQVAGYVVSPMASSLTSWGFIIPGIAANLCRSACNRHTTTDEQNPRWD